MRIIVGLGMATAMSSMYTARTISELGLGDVSICRLVFKASILTTAAAIGVFQCVSLWKALWQEQSSCWRHILRVSITTGVIMLTKLLVPL